MKKLTIKGDVEEVKKIIESLIERYGGKTTLLEVIKKFNKDEVVLV